MYIGTTSTFWSASPCLEIVDNSVDEAMAGYCSKLGNRFCQITLFLLKIVVVFHRPSSSEKIPTLEVVLTILHAGGKFDNNAYKVSVVFHGVGVSVVNALSKLVAQVKRDGKIYEMVFERGKTVQKMKEIGTSKSNGTTITFWPDDMILRPLRITDTFVTVSRKPHSLTRT